MFSQHCLLISCHESFSLLISSSFDKLLFSFNTPFVVHLTTPHNSPLTKSICEETIMLLSYQQTEELLAFENQKFQKNRSIRTVFFDYLNQHILKP